MIDNVLQISREQIEKAIAILNPCMNDYIYVYDLIDDYYVISEHAVERFILPEDKFYDAAAKHKEFVYEDDYEMLSKELQDIKDGKKVFHNMKYRWLDKNHNPIWINCRGSVLFKDGRPHYLMGCINEIGVKPEADNVSGLLGDVGLADYIREAYAALTPKGFIIRIGIDNFSAINTNYGMAYGDYILKKTADCIANTLNSNQKLFKLVSDEFMIVDFSGSNITEAIKIYMNCKKNVNKFIEDNNYKIMYTLSAGVIDASHIKDEDDSYIKLSEFALKQAKDSGKNTYYIYRNEDFEHYNRRRVINTALHNAVDDDFAGFEVYYQPIVDTKTYRLIGAEALMRFFMPDPDGGSPQFVSPVEFIPLLEEKRTYYTGRQMDIRAVSQTMCYMD